jgi:hypothetical protein
LVLEVHLVVVAMELSSIAVAVVALTVAVDL